MNRRKIKIYFAIYVFATSSTFLLTPLILNIILKEKEIPDFVTNKIASASILYFKNQPSKKVNVESLINNGYIDNTVYLKDNQCNTKSSYVTKILEKGNFKYSVTLYCQDKKASLTLSE